MVKCQYTTFPSLLMVSLRLREIHDAEVQNQTASHESILVLIYRIPRQPVLLYTAGEEVGAISQLIVRGWWG